MVTTVFKVNAIASFCLAVNDLHTSAIHIYCIALILVLEYHCLYATCVADLIVII